MQCIIISLHGLIMSWFCLYVCDFLCNQVLYAEYLEN